MEPPVVRSRGRPRKRRNTELQDGTDETKVFPESCKRMMETRPVALLGRYMLKEFKGSGKYLGKVVFYEEGLYRVVYEDGDSEDLESGEIRGLLVEDSFFVDNLSYRKKRLDELPVRFSMKSTDVPRKNGVGLTENVDQPEASVPCKLNGDTTASDIRDGEVDFDSSSESAESLQDRDCAFETEAQFIPPPPLPTSSGTIGISEQHVSHLFSVYGFLRSFSFCLFLFPFSLDDFVGSLNCGVSNSLLDAIHLALMRALRGHLEFLSSDGLEIASKCMRYLNWNLLDSLTWPVYLVQYLTVMGYTKGLEWNGFYKHALNKEYYSISVGQKLTVLQILCDDVLKSAEIRAEINMRAVSEFGPDYDAGPTCLLENGPRRVHPRYPKTSACKDGEAMEIIVENHGMKSYTEQNYLGKGDTNGDLDTTAIDANRNSDECRICGMDGSLLCCDGCPSAYHLRCIGMVKTLIPQGPWYCPECSINKTEPAIANGSSLRGAEIFGIDSHGLIFLGSCNHLLVLQASIDAEACPKYYNQNDILGVLHVLCSSSQYIPLYYDICKAIMQYWDIPENLLILPETSGISVLPANLGNDTNVSNHSLPSGREDHVDVVEDTKVSLKYMGNNVLPNGFVVDSASSNCSVSKLINKSTGTHCPDVIDVSSTIDLVSTSTSKNFSHSGNASNTSVHLSYQSRKENLLGRGKVNGDTNSSSCTYMGSLYKPQSYVNHYLHGEFAASAAAKLEILSSEETRLLATHASDNKKSSSAYALLQAKAFSQTASRFFWPTFDKKLMEVPRERCGWCLSCKAPVLSKKGCLLNHAALAATKGATKIFSGLRLRKNGEGILSCVAAYILYMEDSLCGLVGGPFLNSSYRKQWRHQLQLASSCSLIVSLLLKLEENIRSITLSGNWYKLVDDWFLETSMIQNTSIVGPVNKRGPSGKRSRKQSIESEAPSLQSCDRNFVWFQGRLSKLIFQRAALPRSMAARAARQGGLRKISGIYYTEGSEIPKRSRQFVWRAAVEASRNASQLAFQVKNLDSHLRWSDLVRPEQTLQDAKGQETEAFRNACIGDKKTVENKIMYGVAFGSQKHLPSRVMKNVVEVEQGQDGKAKYWFSENCIPLYLVREYEESLNRVSSPSEHQNLLNQLRRRHLKSFQREIFFYLTCRRDNMGLLSCSSCQKDVLMRSAAKCSSCRGYCHEDCIVRLSAIDAVEFPIKCKQCYFFKALNPSEKSSASPTSPLPLQVKNNHNLASSIRKSARPKGIDQPPPPPPVNKQIIRSEMKEPTSESSLASKSRRRNCSWGVIWKKKSAEDTGVSFRLNYVLLKGASESHHLKPKCHLCSKPYRSEFMYICCETCKYWYHAEALELDESKINEVMGFKCCKCRRIKSPECPYTDPKHKKQEGRKTRAKTSKQLGGSGVECETPMTISESEKLEFRSPLLPKNQESEQDPLLFSLSKVELITEPKAGLDDEWNSANEQAAPQKLPVRRLTKQEDDADGFSETSFLNALSSTHYETNTLENPTEKPSSSFPEWNTSNLDLEGDTGVFDFASLEDMDFEPQTYFSFTELLEPDDAEFCGIESSRDGLGNVENPQEPAECIPVVNCELCRNTDPPPDLSCRVCGIQIHNYCSPWGDPMIIEETWACGRCREWE